MAYLCKTHKVALDHTGCEFPYVIYSTYEHEGLKAKHNTLLERLYYQPWYDLRASTLEELKAKFKEVCP